MWAFLHTVAWSVCNIKTGIFPHHSVPLGGYVLVKSKLQHSPPPPPGHLTPLLSRGGEFELHPWFHVKSLAWQAIIGDAALEDFRGKDCSFMANWLRGKGLNKLCAVFEGIQILILFFNIGYRLWIYECIKLCLQWNRIPVLAIQCNNKRLNRGKREWQRSITLTCHMCVN